MEIIFDENRNEVFQGKKYQVIEMQASGDTNFTDIRKAAAKLVRDNKNNETVIIHPDSENKDVWLFAALLSLSNPDEFPLKAVFKVEDCQKALRKYKPYLSFSVAAKYIFRLLDMNSNEIYKDIQTLNYLGLDIKTDYASGIINLHLPNSGKKYEFKAVNLENALILASFIKMLSLIKYTLNIDVKIQIRITKKETPATVNKEKILQKLYWCARPFLDKDDG